MSSAVSPTYREPLCNTANMLNPVMSWRDSLGKEKLPARDVINCAVCVCRKKEQTWSSFV